jgi:anaerobic magnesium-protoporphyrin IX monomethyl ester cyclase
MKITFIQSYYKNVWEALGLGYIIAYVKKHYKGDLEINFFQAKFDKNSDIIECAKDSDIVAFSCTSPAYNHGIALATLIKALNSNVHTVFGGWHPTALPDDVIKEECVDQVIVGEGEYAMRLVVEGNREPIIYGSRMNTDLIRWPDREAIKNERTINLCERINGQRTASFQMNRGCKVHCAFCAERLMSGKGKIRTRDNNDVLDEIVATEKEYGIDYFKFVDATFDVSPEQVIKFCAAKINRSIDLEWECNIHAGFVQKEEVFYWLKRANCNQVNIGCESGSPKVLKGIGKGTNVKQIKNVFKWAKSHGIKRRGYFLIGMPDENFEDLEQTEELIDEIEPDVLGFTILAPYPGSDFYVPSLHKDIDWSNVGEYGNDIWRNKEYDNAGLKRIQAYFTAKYANKLCEVQRK